MSKFNFNKVKENMLAIKVELPQRLANIARNHFLDSFKKQGWEGESWQEVKRRIPGTKAYKWHGARHAELVSASLRITWCPSC